MNPSRVSSTFFGFFAAALAAMIPLSAYASEGHGESPFGWPFIFSVINFTILVIVLYFVMKGPAKEFFRKRATTTKLEMDRAKKYYDEANLKYKEIDERLNQADIESRKLLESLKSEGEAEKRVIIEHADKLAAKIREDSQRIISQELKRAQEALKLETVNLATDLAAKHVGTMLSNDDQVALGQEFISQIESGK